MPHRIEIQLVVIKHGRTPHADATVHPTQVYVSWEAGAELHWVLLNGGTLTFDRPSRPAAHSLFTKPQATGAAFFTLTIPPASSVWPRGAYQYAVSGTSPSGEFHILNCPEIIIE